MNCEDTASFISATNSIFSGSNDNGGGGGERNSYKKKRKQKPSTSSTSTEAPFIYYRDDFSRPNSRQFWESSNDVYQEIAEGELEVELEPVQDGDGKDKRDAPIEEPQVAQGEVLPQPTPWPVYVKPIPDHDDGQWQAYRQETTILSD